MTEQERLRKSLRFWLMRKLWVKAGDVSRWAGRRIVAWSRAADERDYAKSNSHISANAENGLVGGTNKED